MGDDGHAHAARVEISADGLLAELVVPGGGGVAAPDKAAIVALAKDAKVDLTPDVYELIDEACTALMALGGGAARIPIARGHAPQHGVAGHISFEPGYDPAEVQQALERAATGA